MMGLRKHGRIVESLLILDKLFCRMKYNENLFHKLKIKKQSYDILKALGHNMNLLSIVHYYFIKCRYIDDVLVIISASVEID